MPDDQDREHPDAMNARPVAAPRWTPRSPIGPSAEAVARGKIGGGATVGNPRRSRVLTGLARLVRTPLVLGLLGAWGCGLGLTDADNPSSLPRSEAYVLAAPGFSGVVQVDSLSWLPALVPLGQAGPATELEGVFGARFANHGQRLVQIRYDLRFYDRDEFLLDNFIPFGQPVRLEPGTARYVTGEFRLRAGTGSDLFRVAAMRLYATVGDTTQ